MILDIPSVSINSNSILNDIKVNFISPGRFRIKCSALTANESKDIDVAITNTTWRLNGPKAEFSSQGVVMASMSRFTVHGSMSLFSKELQLTFKNESGVVRTFNTKDILECVEKVKEVLVTM